MSATSLQRRRNRIRRSPRNARFQRVPLVRFELIDDPDDGRASGRRLLG